MELKRVKMTYRNECERLFIENKYLLQQNMVLRDAILGSSNFFELRGHLAKVDEMQEYMERELQQRLNINYKGENQ